jgi:hypothetical protein
MEDFKIPEHLGRFAVKAGMKTFVQERRARGVFPNDSDPHAFGAPVKEGGVAANHKVAERGGKKRGLGRVVVMVAAAAVLCVVLNRRRERVGWREKTRVAR